MPAGLESVQQPYASHRQSPSPSPGLAADHVAWDAATRALSRAATCLARRRALRYCGKVPLLC